MAERIQHWYSKFTEPIMANVNKCIYGTKYADKVVAIMSDMNCVRSRSELFLN